MPEPALADAVSAWFATAARDLPWRRPGTSAWAVLVSELMLQQTPVARVLPAYDAWLSRWPTPAALAAVPAGEAVRQWGRLGYPRRALRLHGAATVITTAYAGVVPTSLPDLLALPGVGDYTARAVAAFAHRQRHPVVDTNVRRVVARALLGVADRSAGRADLSLVESLLPLDEEAAAVASAALMELGALVCTARSPRCGVCPVRRDCAWLAAGRPAPTGSSRRAESYAGSDRQVRGRLLEVLRIASGAVPPAELEAAWPEPTQRLRALTSLVADGLVQVTPGGSCQLPG